MGAGDTLAGDTFAGDDPEIPYSRARAVTPPQALLFDGATRDFPIDADGLYVATHPVDQRVAIALLTIRGTLASTPDTGSDIRRIRYIDPLRIRAQVTDAVERALAAELRDGNVRIVSVTVETPRDGALGVTVRYENLRLPVGANTDSFRTIPLSLPFAA